MQCKRWKKGARSIEEPLNIYIASSVTTFSSLFNPQEIAAIRAEKEATYELMSSKFLNLETMIEVRSEGGAGT